MIPSENGHEKNNNKNELLTSATASSLSTDAQLANLTESDMNTKRKKSIERNRQMISIEIFHIARPMAERTPNPVFEIVPEEILQVKIADLGNACWTVRFIRFDIKESNSLMFF